jgi:hypothetical protein
VKPITTTVGGRVTLPVRKVLEEKAAEKGTTLSALISRMLTNAARRWGANERV